MFYLFISLAGYVYLIFICSSSLYIDLTCLHGIFWYSLNSLIYFGVLNCYLSLSPFLITHVTLSNANYFLQVIPAKPINAVTLRVTEGKCVLIGGLAIIEHQEVCMLQNIP